MNATLNSPAEGLLSKYADLADHANVWIAPNIPPEVLNRALKHCRRSRVSKDNILLVVEDWAKNFFWGKTDNFLILTKDRIIGCEPYIECEIYFSEITGVSFIDNGDCYIFGFDHEEKVSFAFFNMNRDFCDLFCELLTELGKAANLPSPKKKKAKKAS